MRIEVHNRVSDFNSYRSARVKSLFNAENGCNFDLVIDNVDLSGDWNIGVVVGPSGSGKTSIGKMIFGDNKIYNYTEGWSPDKPIIDDISPDGDFNEVTGALSSVGLGDVPAWLRPFRVLSNGEQFRAGLAKIICEKPSELVIDEFTSVIDRQIARIGSNAFQKAFRRSNPKGKVVLLTPHYDILEWVQPDWVIDTNKKTFTRGLLWQRPKIKLDVWKVDQSYWKFYKPHYYLDLPMPIAGEYFIGTVDGELACHLAICPRFEVKGYRGTRLVTMPEWQGAGVATRFLDFICEYHLQGKGRKNKKYPTYFHTSHPQLCGALRRSKKWIQVSGALYGGNKKKSVTSMGKSRAGKKKVGTGYGGHFRAVQGFKYVGEQK